MSKQKIVHLRVYRRFGQSKGVVFDENRTVQNENILVKLVHGALEWANYLKYLHQNEFIKAKVEKVLQGDKEIDVKDFQAEVDRAFTPAEVPMTADQKRIAALEAQIAELSGKKKGKSNDDDDLKDLKVKYEEVFGKKPFNGWDADTIKSKIEEEEKK